tara:strand:+ start:3868 stop:4173 length:306 start_codon:yes stop_codon:yes gene_type:complete
MECRTCGAPPNEDGDSDCYCGYARTPCEGCDEEVFDIELEYIIDYTGQEFFGCSQCVEDKQEEKKEWLFDFQMSFEGILADFTLEDNWNKALHYFQAKSQH